MKASIDTEGSKAKKGKKSKGKKSASQNVDDDSELFENEKNLEDNEMMKDLNEQDLEDLKEIRALEKIASIRQSQGIEDGHDDIDDLIIPEEKKKPKKTLYPFANSKEVFNDVSLDYDDDDKLISPVTQNDFLYIA